MEYFVGSCGYIGLEAHFCEIVPVFVPVFRIVPNVGTNSTKLLFVSDDMVMESRLPDGILVAMCVTPVRYPGLV
jgi:hypothetical protein